MSFFKQEEPPIIVVEQNAALAFYIFKTDQQQRARAVCFATADNMNAPAYEALNFTDFGPTREKREDDSKAAFGGYKNLKPYLSAVDFSNFDSFKGDYSEKYTLRLLTYLEFFRHTKVKELLINRYEILNVNTGPVDFSSASTTYRTLVDLNWLDKAELLFAKDLSRLFSHVERPNFKDDAYNNAAYTMRTICDLMERMSRNDDALKAITLSDNLQSNKAKKRRVIALAQNTENTDLALQKISEFEKLWGLPPDLARKRKNLTTQAKQ